MRKVFIKAWSIFNNPTVYVAEALARILINKQTNILMIN